MPYFGIPIRNGLPIGLGSVAGFGAFQFSPSVLFAAGEQGAWYDPSDLTTLFQDAAGTTPTTMETRARLMLDKSKGLVLGSEQAVNGSFASSASWTTDAGWSISGGQATTSNSTGFLYQNGVANKVVGTVYRITFTVSNYVSGNVRPYISGNAPFTTELNSNGPKTVYLRAVSTSAEHGFAPPGATSSFSIDDFSVRELAGNHATAPSDASSPILRARYNLLLNSATLSTQSVTTVATGYVLRFEGAGSIALSGTASGTLNAGSHTITCTAGTLTLTVTGTVTSADLRTTTDAALNIPAYQSITTATSYDTAGFPPYLAFDGTDDSFSTASIDFTGTDKMTVWAGLTKLSDANRGMVTELGNNVNSSFQLNAPSAATLNNYGFSSRGTIFPGFAEPTPYVAPVSSVVTGIGEISTDTCLARVNGIQQASNTNDQGTGNFGNYPLFIGRRDNTSFPFNGRLYSLIIRGAATTTPLIASTEQWVAGKMRLPI